MPRAIIGCFVFLSLFATFAFGQSLEFAGSALWNNIFDAAVVGDYAYCGFKAGIAVVDISDPVNLLWIGSCNTPLIDNGFGGKVVAAGNLVYAICDPGPDSQDIVICDVSDPAHPTLAGTISTPLNGITGLAADPRGYLFFSDFARRLVAMNVSDPALPVEVAAIPRTAVYPTACALEGHTLYIVEADSLHLYDVTIPSAPAYLGGVCMGVGVGADRVTVHEGFAYAACVYDGLRIIDATDPTQPELAGVYDQDDALFSEVYVVYHLAYCWQGTSGVLLVDVANPDLPQFAGYYDNNLVLRSAGGDRAVGVSRQSEAQALCILNVQNPVLPSESGRCQAPADEPYCMRVRDNLAYILYEHGGIKIVDLSDPSHPELRSVIPVQASAVSPDLALAGDYLFYACGSLFIWDVANPQQPQLVSSTDGDYAGVAVSDNFAYTCRDVNMLDVYDVFDPVNPQYLSTVQLDNSSGTIPAAIDGSRLFLRGEGFSICDLSDPMQPVLVGDYHDPMWPEDWLYEIEPHGAHVGIAYQGCGLQIINVENPSAPWPVFVYGYDVELMTGISMTESLIVAGSMTSGIRLFNRTNPMELASTNAYGVSRCVYVNDQIAVAANSNQLVVFNLFPQTGPEHPDALPAAFALDQNYPNPFNATTTLRYALEREARVQLTVFNLMGQEVADLVDRVERAGSHTVLWEAEGLPSGLYCASLKSGPNQSVMKMVLLR